MRYIITSAVFLLDRLAKLLILINLAPGESIPFLPYIYITRLHNTGIAFSMFTGNNKNLIWINLAVIIAIFIISRSRENSFKPMTIAYSLIIGGALSNLWDRLFYGGVIDYIDCRVWPVFNFADMSISAGAVIMIFLTILEQRKRKTGKD